MKPTGALKDLLHKAYKKVSLQRGFAKCLGPLFTDTCTHMHSLVLLHTYIGYPLSSRRGGIAKLSIQKELHKDHRVFEGFCAYIHALFSLDFLWKWVLYKAPKGFVKPIDKWLEMGVQFAKKLLLLGITSNVQICNEKIFPTSIPMGWEVNFNKNSLLGIE